MTRLAIALATLATSASADAQKLWPGNFASNHLPSTVTIHEPTAEGATATVTFKNTEVHHMDEIFPLEWEGIAITVHFDWQADDTAAERIEVDAPDGYVAVPRSITVDEQQTGVIHLFKYLGG